MSKYNHMFDIAFSVVCDNSDPYEFLSDNPEEIREAVRERVNSIGDCEIVEAVSWCDTYEIEEEEVSDTYEVEKFIDALEPIKHDREENTMLLSIPLDVWEKYMGDKRVEYTRDQIEEAVVKYVHDLDLETLIASKINDLYEFYTRDATQEDIDNLMEETNERSKRNA